MTINHLSLPDSAVVTRVGWTLIHFLWQGAMIGLIHAACQAMLRHRPAHTRYVVGCLALALMTAAPVLTFFALDTVSFGPASITEAASRIPEPSSRPAIDSGVPIAHPGLPRLAAIDRALPTIVGAWLVGVVALAIRLLGGCYVVHRRWQRDAHPVGEPWQSQLNELGRRLAITRPVRLLKSACTDVPFALGWLRPVIVLPLATLAGLSPRQLETILAHELAHVRRHDYLVNLIQRAIETLLFYHPAVWWISARIRHERELCCDDLVVRVCGDQVAYARALTTLEGLRSTPLSPALGATNGDLSHRIRRLLGLSDGAHPRTRRRIVVVGAMGALVACLIGGWAIMSRFPIYVATARIRVINPAPPAASVPGREGSTQTGVADPHWIQTEMHRLLSASVLGQVVDRAGLAARFAERSGRTEPLTQPEAVQRLRRQVSCHLYRSTDLLEIRVRSEQPQEAAALANLIANSYRDWRRQMLQESRSMASKSLQAQLMQQSERVEKMQAETDQLRRALGFSETAAGGNNPLDVEALRVFERERAVTEVKLASLDGFLDQVRSLPREKHADVVAGLTPPDPLIEKLKTDRLAAEQAGAGLQHEYGPDSPQVRSNRALVAAIQEQTMSRVSGVIDSLRSEQERQRAQLTFLTKRLDEARRLENDVAEKYQPYFRAKRELENARRLHETLHLRWAQEQMDAQAARAEAVVEIVDLAEPPLRPSGRW